MANPDHLKRLKEGATSWNTRRSMLWFKPDLQDAELRAADLREANLVWADLRRAGLQDADLSGTDLRGATLQEADLHEAKLQGARLRTIVSIATSRKDGGVAGFTDFSMVSGLMQAQIEQAHGDNGVVLPKGLTHPAHWDIIDLPQDHPNYEGEAGTEYPLHSDESARGPQPHLPSDMHGSGVAVTTANKLALGHEDIPPQSNVLAGLYQDLRDMISDLRNLGDLDNVAPILGRSLTRFYERVPDQFEDLEQHRFGASTAALHLQFKAERPKLEENADSHVGHIEALLYQADLITARLPDWQSFLTEEEDTKEVFLAREEDSTAILELAADALRKAPETFDTSLFERVREYLDDKTIEGYLASKELLLSIAHKTFTLAGDLLKDTVSEARKIAIKGIAAGLVTHLGAALLKLAGLLPKQLDWLAKWMEYLPTLL